MENNEGEKPIQILNHNINTLNESVELVHKARNQQNRIKSP